MLARLLDLLFPRRSLKNEEGAWITEEELRHLRPVPVLWETAILRARDIRSLDRLFAAGEHDRAPMLRKAVHRLKYKRVREFSQPLGKMLAETLGYFTSVSWEGFAVCPVPLHWMRKFNRGFNQAELLACVIAREHGLPHRDLLYRLRRTGSQVGRKRLERKAAMKGVFAVRRISRIPESVLLVDDVATTGATLDACALTLKNAGVQRVDAVVLALG